MLSSDLLKQLDDLPKLERERLIRAGLYEAAQARIQELKAEIKKCEDHIREFEQRYGVTFEEFEQTILPNTDSWTAHDDYNDWFYWEQVLAEKKALLRELEHIKER